MAVSFGNKIITRAQLRAEIGDPSTDPSSVTYVTDAQLDALILRYDELAKGLVDEKVKNLTEEEIFLFAPQATAVNVALTSGDAQYPSVANGSLDATYFPFVFRAVHANGTELAKDDAINWTATVFGPLYTDTNKLYRYRVIGSKILVLPSDSINVKVFQVLLSVVEAKLAPQIIDEVNVKIIDAARRMMADRMSMAGTFKQESKTEAP